MTPSMNHSSQSAKGIVGIFELFMKFFSANLEILARAQNFDNRVYLQKLEGKFKTARNYAQRGRNLALEISALLAKSDKLIDSVNAVQQGLQDARKGLRGMSDFSEEVVTGIQATSDSIQETLENVKKNMELLEGVDALGESERAALASIKEDIGKVSDLSFNIVIELQFQDILRQQVSAIASILAKTKQQIASGMEKITGLAIATPEEEEGFAVTDMSVLGVESGKQDAVDDIINKSKEKSGPAKKKDS